MRALVIGRTGQLGGDLIRLAPEGVEVIAPSRQELDIESSSSGAFIRREKPSLVINTAAFHNVPLCETHYSRAFSLNCIAVRDIALAASEAGARLVTFSSDYVFGGNLGRPCREGDPAGPLQVYGITRLAGEYAALAAHPDGAIVIRTCGLYGISGSRSKGGNFVDNRISDMRSKDRLEISSEQVVSPTYTADLADAVWRLALHNGAGAGIYHLVNEGACSWFEFACAIRDIMGFKAEVLPVDRHGLDRTIGAMRRPLLSALENTRAKAMDITLPHWRDALERYLAGAAR